MRRLLKWLLHFSPGVSRVLLNMRDRRAVKGLKLAAVPGEIFSMWGGNWFAAGGCNGNNEECHEKTELRLLSSLIDGTDALIDVGANSGLFSLMAASRGVRAIAIEPMAANVAVLIENIVHNGFDSLIEVAPIAVADKVGLLPVFGSGQSASLLRGWGGRMDSQRTVVPINTLDNLFWDRFKGKKIVIKLDAEGAELQVLRGATNLIRVAKALLVENSLTRNYPTGFNPNFEPIFRLLWAHEFRAYIASHDQVLVTEELLMSWVASRRIDINTENFLFLRH